MLWVRGEQGLTQGTSKIITQVFLNILGVKPITTQIYEVGNAHPDREKARFVLGAVIESSRLFWPKQLNGLPTFIF